MSDPCEAADDDALLESWFQQWRLAYVTRGEDTPPENFCGDRFDLVRALRGLIQFEKLSLGGPVPKIFSAESRYEVIGPYEPDHRGGQGELYLATDPAFPRVVLVKRIRTERATDADAIRKFQREMLLNGQLEHPNIVPVFDYGTDNGEPFFVMRLVPGETYHLRILRFHEHAPRDRYRSPDFLTLLQNFIIVCRAVGYAHSRMALHLDISTANIRIGDHGEVYLLDWGAGRRDRLSPEAAIPHGGESLADPVQTVSVDNERDLTSSVNPSFMAPEQASHSPALTRATDIYQLGATLYVLLTGKLAFEPVNVGSKEFQGHLQRIARGEQPLICSELRVPGPLQSICRKAMSADPDDRFASAEEMSRQLDRWLRDAEVAGHAYSLAERFDMSRRKHPGRWTAIAATLMTAVLAFAIGTGLLLEKNKSLVASIDRAARAEEQTEKLLEHAFNMARELVDGDLDSLDRLEALDKQRKAFGDRNDQSKTSFLRGLAAIQHGRCRVLRRLNRFQEAEDAGLEAQDLLEKMNAGNIEGIDRVNLIRVLHDLGDNFLDRGNVKAAKVSYDDALMHLDEFGPEIEGRPELLVLRCFSHRKLGRFYEDIGNPWLAHEARQRSLADAETAFAIDHSDHMLVEFANSVQLVSRSQGNLGSNAANPFGTEGLRADALANAREAIRLLEEVQPHTRRTRRWLEDRYYAEKQLATALQENHQLTSAGPHRHEAAKRLDILVATDPSRVDWFLEHVKLRVDDLFFQDDMKLLDVNAVDQQLLKLRTEFEELSAQFPENTINVLLPGDFMVAAGKFEIAKRLDGQERERYLREASEFLVNCERALRIARDMFPGLARPSNLLQATLQKQAEIALLRQDQASYLHLTSEAHRVMQQFYQARLDEAPDDVTWTVLAADQVRAEAYSWFGRDLAKCEELFTAVIARYAVANEADPDNHFWISRLAEALKFRSDVKTRREYEATGKLSLEVTEQDCDTLQQALLLQRKCCDLTLGDTRRAYREVLDDTYDGVMPLLRNELLLGKGSYLARFGGYESLRRRWESDRDKYLTDSEVSPLLPRTHLAFLHAGGEVHWLPILQDAKLNRLEGCGQLLRFSWLIYDDDIVHICADRIRKLREQMVRGDLSEPIQAEIIWMLRSMNGAMKRMAQRGEKSRWLARMRGYVKQEFEELPPAKHLWTGLIQTSDHWEQMNYVALGQLARSDKQLAGWFKFVNDEFVAAASVQKSRQATFTYAESMVYRQILDDLFLDAELRADVLGLAKQHLDDQIEMQSSFRSMLGVLAMVAGESELAHALEAAVSDENVMGVKRRIAEDGIRQRQFRVLRGHLESWHDTASSDFAALVFGYHLAICQHQLGETENALAIIQTLSERFPDAIAWTGLRLAMLLDQYRDRPELIAKLGNIGEPSPDMDLNAAMAAAYVSVVTTMSADAIVRLEQLAERPDCENRVWAYELLGDAHRSVGNAAAARRAYENCRDELPPTTALDDLTLVRVSNRLSELSK